MVCGTAAVEVELPVVGANIGTQPLSPDINGRVVAWAAVYETPVVDVAKVVKAVVTFLNKI